MNFLQRLIRNILIAIVMLGIFYFLFPDLMGPLYQGWAGILGPGLIIIILIIAVLPKRWR